MKKLKYISIEKQKRKKFILGSVLGCATAGVIIALPIYFLAHENKINRKKINQTNLEKEKNIFSEKMLSIIPFRNDELHNKERYINIFNNKNKYLELIKEAKNNKELNEIFNEWKEQIDGYKKSSLNFVSTNAEITGGNNGTIFQAENGDIYAMGKNSKLEVLKHNAEEFKITDSNIINGENGVIFQARNGDIYVLGKNTNLQILKARDNVFQDVPNSIKGAIFGDVPGLIFESHEEDIYAIGGGLAIGERLKVMKKDSNKFIFASKQAEPSTIFHTATVFQAKNGDIYLTDVMPAGLYILEKNDDNFKNIESKISKAPVSMSKYSDSTMIDQKKNGVIFQAKNGDIYVAGANSELQVLENGSSEFHHSFKTNIKKGAGTKIFEAKNGDIYTMGERARLQIRKYGHEVFVDVPTEEPIQGVDGTIFQAKNGDIYAMGENSKLQVLKW